MNKKVLTIAIAVVVIIVGASFVSAAKGPQNPYLGGDLSSVWVSINDLYAKVAALTEQVDSVPAVHFGEPQMLVGEDDDISGAYVFDAETDGIVTGFCWSDPNTVGDATVEGLIDNDRVVTTRTPELTSITLPVRKGDSVTIFWSNCEYDLDIKWWPLTV